MARIEFRRVNKQYKYLEVIKLKVQATMQFYNK